LLFYFYNYLFNFLDNENAEVYLIKKKGKITFSRV